MSCMLPGIIEKLNDPKDKFHIPARECLALLGGKAYASESLASSQAGSSRGKEKDGVVSQWETAVKDALSGRGARAKVEALKLLLQMRNDPSVKLPLKPWLPSLVNLLEDGDGAVRDQAREVGLGMPLIADAPRRLSPCCPHLPLHRQLVRSSKNSCSPRTYANQSQMGSCSEFLEEVVNLLHLQCGKEN